MKNYLRIGTSYYKKSLYPNNLGEGIEILIPWSPEIIRQDHGKNALSQVEIYDGFVCLPENRREFYKKRILDYYNTYHILSKIPKEGDITNSMMMLKHVFRDQLEIGIDYVQLLYLKPSQILPILCLVSNFRNTGKSSFLKWLKEIFEYNLTYITNDSFASNFNADWSSKLLICIDEVLFKTDELTERIKYLSTTNVSKMESKGKDRKEVYFFGKFIMCSNNEHNFIKIDAQETRFWVRKIEALKHDDVDFLDKLISEIPAFLYFLSNRKLSTENKSRMWFTPQQIKTKALDKLVKFNSSKLEVELASVLINTMDSLDTENIQFCFSDLLNFLNKFKIKHDANEIKKIIRNDWKLQQQSNSNQYQKITITNDLDFYQNLSKGRYYTVSRAFLLQNFDELMTKQD